MVLDSGNVMRVFIAGASGVLGSRIIPMLVEMGHSVAGMTRSFSKLRMLSDLGAEPVHCDVYDLDELIRSVSGFHPDIIIDQLTDLPDRYSDIVEYSDANDRIRIEGTANLIAAARLAGSPRIMAQSVAWKLPGKSAQAVDFLERSVLDCGGTVLRYGQLYGEGTFHEYDLPDRPRIHVNSAVSLTVKYLEASSRIIDVFEED